MAKEPINFKITETIGVLSTNDSSKWTKELNKVSWDGRDPKYDLRDWSPDHTRMGKGVTLTEDEVAALKDILNKEV